MSEDKPVGIRVTRPYATREDYLAAECEHLGRSHVHLIGVRERPPGTLVRFEIRLSSGEPVVRAEGRVIDRRSVTLRDEAASVAESLYVKLTRIDSRTKALLEDASRRKYAMQPIDVNVEAPTSLSPASLSQAPPAPVSNLSLPDDVSEPGIEGAADSEPKPNSSTGRPVTAPRNRDALLAKLRSRLR